MNVFQTMLARAKSSAVNSDHLPELNAFVDVAVGGKTESVPVEALGRTTFQVRRPVKAAAGLTGLFNYVNGRGGFRFSAECTEVSARLATFTLPAEITIINKFDDKRRNFRLKYGLAVLWRYAPEATGYGDFIKGTTADISGAGMSLVVPRELKVGTQVEVKLDLEGSTKAFFVIGTLMRPTVQQGSGKYIAGIAMKNLSPTQSNAISEFIAQRQKGQKKRSLAEH